MTGADDASANLGDVLFLRRGGHLTAIQSLAAFGLVRDDPAWNAWAHRLLLAFGAGHLLAAVIFFFAFNWFELPPMVKLGFLQATIIVAAVSALFARLDTPAGQALLIAATVLLGVLLAVIGQVYQTGADAYELFVGWAALGLLFALPSRSPAHWLVWLVIADFAVWLYGDQVLIDLAQLDNTDAYLLPGLLTAAALAARELLTGRGFDWLAAQWTRLTLVGLSGLLLLGATGGRFFSVDSSEFAHAAMFLWIIAVIAFYRWRRFDGGAASLAAGLAALWLITTGLWALMNGVIASSGESLLGLLAIATLWCVAVTGALAKAVGWLRRAPGSSAA